MNVTAAPGIARLALPFQDADAPVVAKWVRSNEELRFLAPGTQPPLNKEKISGWQLPRGRSYVGRIDADGPCETEGPIVAYGELNLIASERSHLWLGHCIVDPALRRQGVGGRFVTALLEEAFGRLAADKVSLIVFPENGPAIRCYLKAGFEQTGEEWHSFRGGPNERLLRLEAFAARG